MYQRNSRKFTLSGSVWMTLRWAVASISYCLVGLLFWFSIGDNVQSIIGMVPVASKLEYIDLVRINSGLQGRGGIELRTKYSFEYLGAQYIGTHVVLGSEWRMSGIGVDYALYDLVQKLKEKQGSTITVWVDPARPNISSIEKRIHKSTLWLYGFLTLFGVGAIFGLNRRLDGFFHSTKENA